MSKHIDLTNYKSGRLTVIGRGDDYISPSGSHLLRWKCICECGNTINATTSQIKRGLSSCGCVSRREDLTGKKYGELLVLHAVDDYVSPKGSHMSKWHCLCSCGNEIDVIGMSLKNGDNKSCGCKQYKRNGLIIDYIGKKYGDLTILSKVPDVNPSKFHCRCSCGNEIDVYLKYLTTGKKSHCGCKASKRELKKFTNKNTVRYKEYVGEHFGELTVIKELEPHITPSGSKQRIVKCRCSCGNEIDIYLRYLTTEKKTHCGCKTPKKSPKEYKKITHCKDYVGKKIGELTVLEELEPHITPNGSKQRIIKCICSCGNETIIRLESAKKSGKCTNCLFKEKRADISGKRYGKLVVESMADDYTSPSGHRLSRCNCICDCGKKCIVNMSALVTGKTQSCGCIHNTAGLLKDNAELMQKYDFEKNSGINLDSLTARASKKIWWKCNVCGNSWFATIASQNDKIKHGCPYCAGSLVIKGKTDLLSRYPDLVNEWWDYSKNKIDPSEISCFSGKKVWWKCKENHSWKSTVANKVNGSGCPKCNIENVNSFCEQAVFFYIKQVFPDAINGDTHVGMELDIFIPSKNVAIEYDGEAWHKSDKKNKIDIQKNDLCISKGIELIRIREPKLFPIDNCKTFVRTDSTSNGSLDTVIYEVLSYLFPSCKIDINTLRDTSMILEQYANKKYNNSLAYVFPEIAAEWHPTKNGNLSPDKVNKGSRYKVWWLGTCGHEWQMKVCERTKPVRLMKNGKLRKPQGCPYCSGKKVLSGFNDLKSQRPDLAMEWNYGKNVGMDPSEISVGSSKNVWWKCSYGHEWQSSPDRRINNSGLCPLCYKKKRSPAVLCIETGEVFINAESAAKSMGIKNNGGIYGCCRGKTKTFCGYHWKYYVDDEHK